MEEFHDDLDDDIVGSGFVRRGKWRIMVLFVMSNPPFHVQLSSSDFSLSIPVDYLLNVFHILYGIGVNICDCSKYRSNLEVFPK